jgi:hypothetical protein
MGTAGAIEALRGVFRGADDSGGWEDIPAPEPALERDPDDTTELPALTDRPAVVAQQAEMTYARHLLASYRHVRRMAKDEEQREGSWVRRALDARWSIQDDFDYATGRKWVPPGGEGGFAEQSGVLYWALIGRRGVATAGFKRWIYSRPTHWVLYRAAWLAVDLCVLAGLGHRSLAEHIAYAIAVPIALVLAGLMLARPRHVHTEDEEIVEEEVPS